jgi:hypothetical protein
LLAVLACTAPLSGCGGGGEFLFASQAGNPVVGLTEPPASAAPPPAPPAPSPQSGPALAGAQPVLFIEKNPDGATFLRVQEHRHEPFTAERIIADRVMGPSPGFNMVIEGGQKTHIKNVDATELKYGLTLQQSADVSIYDYTYNKFNGGGSIYGAAIKLGDNGRPTNGSTYIQRVVADGMQQPDSTYKASNNDFLGVEFESDSIYVRDATGKNFGDAGVDSKSGPIYMMNVTLENAHRMLRAWHETEIVLVNSIINAADGRTQAWLMSDKGTIRHYNTLWCEGAVDPSPTNPKCRTSPWKIEGEDVPASVAQTRIIPLQENPLPKVSPFFTTGIDEIVAEYSKDGGRTWNVLSMPNMGKPGAAPIGDTRYKLPLNLQDADYLFRASYKKNGGRVGETSLVVDETGATK